MIPAGQKVTGSPQFLFLARQAGLDFKPLPWFGRNLTVPESYYLLMSEQDMAETRRIAPERLAARPKVLNGAAFPGARHLRLPFILYGPAKHPGPGTRPVDRTRGSL